LKEIPITSSVLVFLFLTLTAPSGLLAQNNNNKKLLPQEQTTDHFDETDGRLAGQQAAENDISKVRWLAGGTATGVALGLIGTGGITLAASLTSPYPSRESRLLLWNQSPTYTKAFLAEYKSKSRKRRVKYAFQGGLLGTACVTAVVCVSYMIIYDDPMHPAVPLIPLGGGLGGVVTVVVMIASALSGMD
jgi:hypothetical protein